MSWKRGDVAMVDLGYLGKVRPCVVVSIARPDRKREMSVVVPLTTEIRGGECEVAFPKPRWLNEVCVANLLGIAGVDNVKIGRVLGTFPVSQLKVLEDGLSRMLGL